MNDICQEILQRAKLVIGEELAPLSEELLYEMCMAAHLELFTRLREDVSVDEIREQYVRAASVLAVSLFVGLEPGQVESFTAGNVTVKRRSAKAAQDNARSLRAQAETMLLGYLQERDFCFRAVRS